MINNIFLKASRFNQIILEQFGKAAELQMNAFQRYSVMALTQAKKASEVRDVDGLKNLSSRQSEILKRVNEQLAADMKAWQDYSNEARELFQKAISGADESAAPKEKQARKITDNA